MKKILPLLLLTTLYIAASADATESNPDGSPRFQQPNYPTAPDTKTPGVTIAFRDKESVASPKHTHSCELSHLPSGDLRMLCTGEDPYFILKLDDSKSLGPGMITATFRVKSATTNSWQVFWTTDKSPRMSTKRAKYFDVPSSKKLTDWKEYSVTFVADGKLQLFRLDPGTGKGEVVLDSVKLKKSHTYPLRLTDIQQNPLRCTLLNVSDRVIKHEGRNLAPGATLELTGKLATGASKKVFQRVTVPLAIEDTAANWPTLNVFDGVVAQEIPDRTSLRCAITRPGGEEVLLRDGDFTETQRVDLTQGPLSVRVFGKQLAALFSGVEMLGKDERSSSQLDMTCAAYLRVRVEPLKMTFPLMVVQTDRATVALTWSAPASVQPVFAVPNFVDATTSHHLLRLEQLPGAEVNACQYSLTVGQLSLTDAILWGLREQAKLNGEKNPLPVFPKPLRSWEEQKKLYLYALQKGGARGEKGYAHAYLPRIWPTRPYGDIASAEYRLTGAFPKLPEGTQYVPAGGHIRNPAIFFLCGQTERWQRMMQSQIKGILKKQQPDGSWRYDGEFRKGHFEDTSSGWCGINCNKLLEYAYQTGDAEALAGGLRGLKFTRRFLLPRGAQVWECPLHAPDVMASAHLVQANVRAFELTGEKEYLNEARRWAILGVPFVYLWDDGRPIMRYATTPTLCATHWVAPVWIGLPVQWCGGVYAYSLLHLAPYDQTLDWKKLAEGILISAEQQICPKEDGELAGLQPDVFHLDTQRRAPAYINPQAPITLRLALEEKPAALSVARLGNLHVAAPFPVTLQEKGGNVEAVVEAKKGMNYAILVNGEQVIPVTSVGRDIIKVKK